VDVRGVVIEPDEIIKQLKSFEKSSAIKAIVLRIDSSGSAIAAAQEIYKKIMQIKDKKGKTVIASIGNIGASGAYYIALAADKIVANPGALIGSFGAVMEFFNCEELMSKVGISCKTIKSVPFKDIGSPFREMTPQEEDLLKEVITDAHEQFIEAIMKRRNLKKQLVERLADGRILTGRQAYELGLIDQMGTLEDAVRLAAKEAGIKGEPSVVKKEKKRRFRFFEDIFTRLIDSLGRECFLMYKL
jgi:protease-4